MKKLLYALLALAAVFTLAACGSDDDGGVVGADDGETSSPVEEVEHNRADVAFAQGMIPHHEQAIEMAEMAIEQASAPEVRDLAERIKAAQGPEIETLRGWLEEWGEEEAPDDSMGGMEHGSSSGMMSQDDMAELGDLEGAEFEREFLTMMKEHHEGAIAMAETELDEGKFEAALEMAQEIVDTQSAEIEEINELMASLDG